MRSMKKWSSELEADMYDETDTKIVPEWCPVSVA